MDIDNFKRAVLGGCPTKYQEEKHIELLAKIMNNGEDIEAFCDEAMISKATFHRWMKTHLKFKQAYDILLNVAERKWKSYPLKAENFNFPYWHTIMRNRFGYGKSKIKKLDDDSPSGKLEAAWASLQEGSLTLQEYNHFVTAIMTEIKAIELERLTSKRSTQDKPEFSEMNKEELIAFLRS